jgi:hypothetical protein
MMRASPCRSHSCPWGPLAQQLLHCRVDVQAQRRSRCQATGLYCPRLQLCRS